MTQRNNGNDQNAFNDFFNSLEIFKNSKIQSKSIIIDENARNFNKASGISKFEAIRGEVTGCYKVPTKIIWKTIDNSTTVWLDYIDNENKIILKDINYFNEEEARENLAKEFGLFSNV